MNETDRAGVTVGIVHVWLEHGHVVLLTDGSKLMLHEIL